MDYVWVPTAWAGVIDDATPLAVAATRVVDFLLTIAGVIGIISILVSGIMYLLARGDYQTTRKAKNAMIWSIVGMTMVMGAMIVIRTISTMTTGN